MISHEYRCIFIHIPRCAGTSIEYWLVGKDWWVVNSATKHLTASQARRQYAEYWDDYFKFSIVRHPEQRTFSCMKYGRHFGLQLMPDGGISFDTYHEIFGRDIIVEFDHRFYKRSDVVQSNHEAGQIYGNVLDEPIDFTAKLENIEQDMEFVRRQLGVNNSFDLKVEVSKDRIESAPVETISHIRKMYNRDYIKFGYQ